MPKFNPKAIAVALLAAFVVVYLLTRSGIDPALVKDATEMNKQLPKQLDTYTRLDSVQALPHKHFAYNYTVLSPAAEKAMRDRLAGKRETMMAQVCSSMPEFKALGTILDFNYKNTSGGKIASIQINMKDCKN